MTAAVSNGQTTSQALTEVATRDISKQSPSLLHHTFLLGRARFTAQPLSALQTETVMEDALKYLYTGSVAVAEERAHNLIATANFLLLPGLKIMAQNVLKKTVSTENCLFNYYFADKYECMKLKEKCREVINTNFTVVMETEDFLKLDQKQVMEWVSDDDVIVNAEEDIFKGIVKWVSYNVSGREKNYLNYWTKFACHLCLMTFLLTNW